jgi:Toprim-like/DNA primase catalytic core, N-terminal domain
MRSDHAVEFLSLLGCRKIHVGRGWVRSTCPLEYRHAKGSDNTPSFAVSIRDNDSSGCRCLGCGYAGVLIPLLWKLVRERGLTDQRAYALVRLLLAHDQVGMGWLERLTEERRPDENDLGARVAFSRDYLPAYARESTFVHPDDEPQARVPEEVLAQMVADMPPYVTKYLVDERRLSPLTILEWELGWQPMKRRICIPIRDVDRNLVSISGRKFDDAAWGPKYMHSPFKRDRMLFGEHLLNKSIRKGYLCEGFFHVIALAQDGYPNALARMGTHLSRQQADKLVEWFDHLVIVPDGDKAGADSAALIERQLQGRIPTIEVAHVPRGTDIDSLTAERRRELLGPPVRG